jgi:hypothetical protein
VEGKVGNKYHTGTPISSMKRIRTVLDTAYHYFEGSGVMIQMVVYDHETNTLTDTVKWYDNSDQHTVRLTEEKII